MPQFNIGDKVVISTRETFNRRDVIVNITVNHLGTTIYWVRQGGCFSAKELSHAK